MTKKAMLVDITYTQRVIVDTMKDLTEEQLEEVAVSKAIAQHKEEIKNGDVAYGNIDNVREDSDTPYDENFDK